jgi:putative SOS response-associated peptidase YedK
VASVCAEGEGGAARLRLSWHLAPLQWAGEEGRPKCLEVYAFLTTTPNPLVATVNHERMPVLLTREEEFETWLSGSPEEALALAQEYPPEAMCIVQEGFYKEDRLEIAA